MNHLALKQGKKSCHISPESVTNLLAAPPLRTLLKNRSAFLDYSDQDSCPVADQQSCTKGITIAGLVGQ